LGQCCGGAVTLRFSDEAKPVDSPLSTLPLVAPKGLPAIPLWVWGAGHVGRAVVRHALTCRAFDVTWVDDRNDRFPDPLPGGLAHLVAADMPLLAAHAPKDAQHLILTYSHDIDLALCAALIRRGFRFCGLIGSQTKWSRFRRRLTGMGLDPSGITCPIGDRSRGKHPDAIAHGTLAGILNTASTKELQ
jgi:xanthine dehydrogenase accessory factor